MPGISRKKTSFATQYKQNTDMTKIEIVKEVSKSTGIEATTVMAVVEGFKNLLKKDGTR